MFRIGLLFLLIFGGHAGANVTPPSPPVAPLDLVPLAYPLILPMTDRVVVRECFNQFNQPEVFLKAITAFPKEDVVRFNNAFVQVLRNDGFNGVVIGECTWDDDPARGIIAYIVFSVSSRSSGKGVKRVVDVLIKVPGERRWVPAGYIEEREAGPVSNIWDIAEPLARLLIEKIKKARQSSKEKAD